MSACLGCGGVIRSTNPRAVYCGSNCRSAASKARAAGLPTTPRTLIPVPAVGDGSPVVGATRAELDQANRLDTALGQAALALAARIDSGMDTGSSMAAAVKQLQVTLAAATAGAAGVVSRLDQMRERRDLKRRA